MGCEFPSWRLGHLVLINSLGPKQDVANGKLSGKGLCTGEDGWMNGWMMEGSTNSGVPVASGRGSIGTARMGAIRTQIWK